MSATRPHRSSLIDVPRHRRRVDPAWLAVLALLVGSWSLAGRIALWLI